MWLGEIRDSGREIVNEKIHSKAIEVNHTNLE